MKYKIIVMGYYGNNNAGDEAILSVILDNLQRRYGSDSVVVLSANPKSTELTHSVKAIHNFVPSGYVDHFKKYFGRNNRQYRNNIETIKTMNVLIVGGGGLFFDKKCSNKSLIRILQHINWLRKYFKNIIAFGVGIGPLTHKSSYLFIRQVLNKLDSIIVRDQQSLSLLGELNINEPSIFLKEDIVYLLEKPQHKDIRKILATENIVIDKDTIGIALCGYHLNEKSYCEKIIALCNHILNIKNRNILLIPMATGYEDDRVGMRHLIKQLNGNIALLNQEYTPKQKLDIISRVNCIVGERLHSVIMAITVCTPVFGISYMPKVFAVFKKLDELDNQVLMHKTSTNELIEKFDIWWLQRNKQIEKLKIIAEDLKNEATDAFNILFHQIENK